LQELAPGNTAMILHIMCLVVILEPNLA